MSKGDKRGVDPPKSIEYQRELEKLRELFKDVDPAKVQLVDGLIEEAAFLRVQNAELKRVMEQSGMVLIHPSNPNLQKPVEAARQYLKNVNSYAVVIKTLNGVLNKDMIEPDDGLDEFE
ncbi:hypothetical protein [Paenibacillus alkalitolerans]|uniref:hypothetical protein n=1 Tax=Paenibacillus alkalitolerans TaxID=2799335 RepID=UPI0018F61274|nr:hypothetical protein [Paenibacillus alkalitolerans]